MKERKEEKKKEGRAGGRKKEKGKEGKVLRCSVVLYRLFMHISCDAKYANV